MHLGELNLRDGNSMQQAIVKMSAHAFECGGMNSFGYLSTF